MGTGAVIAANAMVTKLAFLVLRQPVELPMTCFSAAQSEASEKVVPARDQINRRWGRRALKGATVPVAPNWRMNRDLIS